MHPTTRPPLGSLDGPSRTITVEPVETPMPAPRVDPEPEPERPREPAPPPAPTRSERPALD